MTQEMSSARVGSYSNQTLDLLFVFRANFFCPFGSLWIYLMILDYPISRHFPTILGLLKSHPWIFEIYIIRWNGFGHRDSKSKGEVDPKIPAFVSSHQNQHFESLYPHVLGEWIHWDEFSGTWKSTFYMRQHVETPKFAKVYLLGMQNISKWLGVSSNWWPPKIIIFHGGSSFPKPLWGVCFFFSSQTSRHEPPTIQVVFSFKRISCHLHPLLFFHHFP